MNPYFASYIYKRSRKRFCDMDKVRILPFILLFGISLSFKYSIAQNNYGSEEELKKEAERLFKEESFSEANSLFSQLLSLYPKDPDYNFKYGVCLLMTGEDKEKPITYLEYASRNKDADKEVLFYLGKAYHMNYRFDNAIATYNSFKKTASKSQIEKFEVDAHILQCENGKKLLNNISDLYVLDKKELSQEEYFRSYDLKEIGGKLLVKLDDFKTPYDKKKKEKSVIYLSPQNNKIFYSSYGADGKNGKDIFVVNRLPNGEWSAPSSLSGGINTLNDEDYPFLHPNGKVLYFSSKGHNSMGGYDIFKSTLDESSNTWSKPVNMDFPISTPGDDILYVTDANEKIAYFSSNRSSENGKIAVYKIGVGRKPVDVTIVNGSLKDGDLKGVKDAKITVKNAETGDLVGSYNTTVDGDYSIYLPGDGKYLYTIEAPNEKSRSEVVVIPEKSSKNIKQEIAFSAEDKVVVKSSSDVVPSEGYASAVDLIKEKAKMEVNTSETAFKEQASATEPANIKVENKNTTPTDTTKKENPKVETKLSNADIVKIASEDAEDTKKEAVELKSQAEKAKQYADQKKKDADSKAEEEKVAIAAVSSMPDGPAKTEKQNEVNTLHEEAKRLSSEANTANSIASRVAKDADLKQQEADLSLKYAKDLDLAVKSSNPNQAIAKLDTQKDQLEKISKQQAANNNSAASYNSIQSDAENKQQELEKAEDKKVVLKKEIENLDKEIANLNEDAKKTKNEQLKEAITEQIKDLEQDKVERIKEVEANDIALVKLRQEAETLNKEAAVVNSIAGTNTNQKEPVKTPTNNENKTVAVTEPKVVEPKNTEPVKVTAVAENKQSFDVVEENLAKEIETTSALETNAAKEQKLADTYTKWVGELNKEIDGYKKEMAGTTDDGYKSVLKLKIEKLENKVEQKKTLASESNKKADDLKQAETLAAAKTAQAPKDTVLKDTTKQVVAVNTITPENKTINKAEEPVVYNEQFNEKLTASTKQGTELEKEQAKVEIYKAWTDSLNSTIKKKQNVMINEPDYAKKEKILEQITVLENELKNKNESLTVSQNKIKQIEQPVASVAKKDTLKNETTNILPKDTVKTVATVNKVNEQPDSVKNKNNALAVTENTNDDSKRVIAKLLEEEADDIRGQANQERSKANEAKTEEEKNQLLANVEVLDQKAKAKQFEGANVTADLNKKNYDNNTAQLAEFKKAAANNTTDDVALADAVADEANYYLKEAKKNRESAPTLMSFSTRQDALESAAENEKIALEKQNKAIEMYKKIYPDYKPGSVTPVNAIASNEVKPITTITPEVKPVVTNTVAVVAPVIKNENKPDTAVVKTEPVVANNTKIENKDTIIASAVVKNENKADTIITKTEPVVVNNTKVENKDTVPASVAIKNENKQDTIAAKVEPVAINNSNTENKNTPEVKVNNTVDSSQVKIENSIPVITNTLSIENIAKVDTTKKEEPTVAVNPTSEIKPISTPTVVVKTEEPKPIKTPTVEPVVSNNNDNTEPEKIDEEVSEAVKNTKEFKSFVALNGEADVTEREAKQEFTNADGFKRKADDEQAYSKKLQDSLETVDSEVAKQQIREQIRIHNDLAATNYAKVDSVSRLANNTQKAAESKRKEAVLVLEFLDDKTYKNIVAVAKESGVTPPVERPKTTTAIKPVITNTIIASTNPVKPPVIVKTPDPEITKPVSKKATDKFEQKNISTYSSSKPIPIDEKLPEGLIYKVQIGAFRSAIRQDLFKGITPITGETTPQGYTRYTAGVFSTLESANNAKDEIRRSGYKDAFVVAFLNGKRVAILQGIANQPEIVNQSQVNTNNNQQPAVTGIAPANNLEEIKGLLYTVQVGVYSRPVSSSQLFNVAPLFSERMSNGLIKYTTGLYNDLNKANIAKNAIVNIGIRDAFVSAYNNGKRTPMEEAKKLEAGGAGVFANHPDLNKTPSTNGSSSTNTASNTPPITNTPAPSEEGVTYSIQIGAFRSEVPVDVANKFIRLAATQGGVRSTKDDAGVTIYSIGSFSAREDAQNLKQKAIDAGISDAFIISFKNGKKVPATR